MAKCLVLGGNGFIGSHLVDSLAEAGHTIVAFDRFGDRQPNFLAHKQVKALAGDFLNRADLAKALQGVDYVFHLISTTTPITAENDPLVDIDTNIKMSIELLEECTRHKIKKVIFASTGGAIYGESSNGPLTEDVLPQPFSPYAIGKLTIEHYLRYFRVKFGLDSVVYRISNPYGERQSLLARQGVIPIFLQHIASGEPITILGDGSMVRDYVYVKDVANMITDSFQHTRQTTYNLGSGHGVSLKELIRHVEKIVDRPFKRKHQPKPATFVDRVVLDIKLFNSEFKVRPTVDLEEGLRRTWEYVLAQVDPKKA